MKVRLLPILGILSAGLVVLLVIILIGGYVWLNHFLQSPPFRHLVSNLVGQESGLAGEFQPFTWSGFSVFSEGYQGARDGVGPIQTAQVNRVRAELRLSSFFRGTWDVPEITIDQASLNLSPPPPLPPGTLPPPVTATTIDLPPSPFLALLPRKVKIGRIICRQASLAWPIDAQNLATVQNTEVTATPDGHTWTFNLKGGTLHHPGFPPMTIDSAFIRLNAPDFLFAEARLRDPGQGTADLRGKIELTGGKAIDINVTFQGIDITQFLTGDWKTRLAGHAGGELKVTGTTGIDDSLRIVGPVRLQNGRIEALPILNTIALLTQTEEFRSIRLKEASAVIDWQPSTLAVTNLILESEQLLKILGGFSTQTNVLTGNLHVGTTPKAIRLIPGASESVFVTANEGYIWTPVTLSGTIQDPKEDLTPRLQTAAVNKVIDAVPSSIREKATDILDAVGRRLGL
jgi:hypothetical protein